MWRFVYNLIFLGFWVALSKRFLWYLVTFVMKYCFWHLHNAFHFPVVPTILPSSLSPPPQLQPTCANSQLPPSLASQIQCSSADFLFPNPELFYSCTRPSLRWGLCEEPACTLFPGPVARCACHRCLALLWLCRASFSLCSLQLTQLTSPLSWGSSQYPSPCRTLVWLHWAPKAHKATNDEK